MLQSEIECSSKNVVKKQFERFKKGEKIEEKWTGPYTIHEDTGKDSYN